MDSFYNIKTHKKNDIIFFQVFFWNKDKKIIFFTNLH